MRLLLDTNIFLEILLDQKKADEAKQLLLKTSEHDFFISDFALHSIGLALLRFKLYAKFKLFLQDMFEHLGLQVVGVTPLELMKVEQASKKFGLDFDDAYQYVAAKQHALQLVSFDKDFDRTDLPRKTPADLQE